MSSRKTTTWYKRKNEILINMENDKLEKEWTEDREDRTNLFEQYFKGKEQFYCSDIFWAFF